ncbi:MAG: hypothetical protein B6I35_03700, partial [Anaerolineaceae bacterium 4572_32.2]
MYKMWEIMERANTGPFCEADDFNYKVFMPKMKEVIKKYDIKYDPDNPVPSDDDLADRIWQAAVEFFLEVGVLNVDTHRRIMVDEAELKEALNVDTHRRIMVDEAELKEALYHAPGRFLVGDGKDTRLWESRRPESTQPPFCIFSPDITCDEEMFLPMSIA